MKCILKDCNNEAIDKKLPLGISKQQYNNGFRFCQIHWDKAVAHNEAKLVEGIKNKITKFMIDWEIEDVNFLGKILEKLND